MMMSGELLEVGLRRQAAEDRSVVNEPHLKVAEDESRERMNSAVGCQGSGREEVCQEGMNSAVAKSVRAIRQRRLGERASPRILRSHEVPNSMRAVREKGSSPRCA